jgi:hypothetical protein
MKAVHVGLGLAWLAWLAVAVGFAFRLPWARPGVLACAVLSLWYLPIGTMLSVIQIALLFALSRQGISLARVRPATTPRHDERDPSPLAVTTDSVQPGYRPHMRKTVDRCRLVSKVAPLRKVIRMRDSPYGTHETT